MSLFDYLEEQLKEKPLADKVRPDSFEGFLGQEKVIGKGSPLRRLLNNNRLHSMIFWGPPGCGKTTLARIISHITNSYFKEISAVSSGIKDLREIVAEAKDNLRHSSTRTIVFVDEIHRYNKAQQDAILPHVENGTIVLIGATTENPSFEVIPALRSRVRIVKLGKLGYEAIKSILQNAIDNKDKGLGAKQINITDECLDFIITYANGDARFGLNLLEAAVQTADKDDEGITIELLKSLVEQSSIVYDKASDEHYDHLSAFQKSLRGSDPDGAIYWLAKMIAGGEDPRIIARRLLVTASEDVSNADPMAFVMASNAFMAAERIGLPEARIPLAQATIYVATAPKSNSAITAIDSALADIRDGKAYSVPLHLKDTHYKDAKKYGYGKGYIYSHANPDARQTFLPEELKDREYYKPKHSNEPEGKKN